MMYLAVTRLPKTAISMNTEPETTPPREKPLARPLHVLAMGSFIVAQPLFDLLGKTPDFFVVRQVGIGGIVLMILALMLVPAVLAAGVAELLGALSGARGRRLIYDLALALLTAAGLLLSLKRTPTLGTWIPIVLAVSLGALFPLIYRRVAGVRMLLTIMAALALVFPAYFLIASPARQLVMKRQGAVSEAIASVKGIANPVPIVFVVFDELPTTSLLDRDGGVDARLFPNFARFAGMSTFFLDAVSDSFFTTVALPEILTGNRHREGLLARADDHPANLFTLLMGQYEVQALEPLTGLYPRQDESGGATALELATDLGILYLHLIAPENLAGRLPNVTTTWEPFGQHTERAADVRRFIVSLRPPEGPGLVFLHSLLPHHPWFYLPSGKRYDPGLEIYIDGMVDEQRGSLGARWSEEPWPVIQAYQRHLLQVAFVDRLLGELLDRIEALDLLDEALVIVTADHGVHFEPGGLVRAPHPTTIESLRRVPLFVKWPGQTEAVVDPRPSRLLDIMPTIADLIGADASWSFDGRSLVPREEMIASPTGQARSALPQPRPSSMSAVWHARVTSTGDPYDIGPFHRDLVGRDVAEVWSGEPAPLSATVDHLARYQAIDRQASMLPTRITGDAVRVAPTAEPARPPALALAINDTVVATTLARQGTNSHRFSFMVKEDTLADGLNAITLFVIHAPDGVPRLRAVELVNQPTFKLRDDGGIEASSGAVCTPDGRYEGVAIGLTFETLASRTEIFGWSRDLEGDRSPDAILVFANGRFVTQVAIDPSRLSRRYQLGDHADDAFLLQLPIEEATGSLRFFAFGQDGCSEIAYRPRILDPTQYNGPFALADP